MEIIRIIITSLGSLIVLFILTKIMGKREMSELSMFDYINSITIGSIAAEMATALEDDYLKPLTAMIVYALFSTLVSYLTCKSIKFRRLMEGNTILLFQNGKIFYKNLLKAKFDVDEFLSMCRVQGYFDLEDVFTIFLEPNGKLSILPKVDNRPVNTKDLNLSPNQNYPLANVIIDGKIMECNLKLTGKNIKWIDKQLANYSIELKDVLLATCDITKDTLNVYGKIAEKPSEDIFE